MRSPATILAVACLVLAACTGSPDDDHPGTTTPTVTPPPSAPSQPPVEPKKGQNPPTTPTSFFVVVEDALLGPSNLPPATGVFSVTNNDMVDHSVALVAIPDQDELADPAADLTRAIKRADGLPKSVQVEHGPLTLHPSSTKPFPIDPNQPGWYAVVDVTPEGEGVLGGEGWLKTFWLPMPHA